MDLRRIGVALIAGAAAFLLVGVAVTAALESMIEFSLFIGLPAGFVAAILVTAVVAMTLDDPNPRRNAVGVAGGAAGVTVLLVTVLGFTVQNRFSHTLFIAATISVVVFAVTYVLAMRSRDSPL